MSNKENQVDPVKLASNPAELTKFVDQTLKEMQTKFDQVAKDVISKMDELGDRIDKLESSLNEIIQEEEKYMKSDAAAVDTQVTSSDDQQKQQTSIPSSIEEKQ
ncbi:hypothetical protein MP228_008428 [Amoeboaphelidium protococcarum]|nr:hypothetical protein MP228_012208 [Amoeboaphelidium protococcarum]KAI3645500.1 hypothetical protein MP228_008428 [Amoeboaphelidium protococcarum]